MSYDDLDDEFNQRYVIMEVKEVDTKYQTFNYANKLNDLIKLKDWNKIIERVKENHKVRLLTNNSNIDVNEEPPLEVECPFINGDIPLFQCLRYEQVPFDVIQVMTDYYPGSLGYVNATRQNMNVLQLAANVSGNLSDERMKIIKHIINMNYKTLDYKHRNNDVNILHNMLRKDPTLCLIQLIVGLNEELIKEVDKKGFLPLHHAATTSPETKVLQFLMSVHPQALMTMSSEGMLPLHLLMKHNFRPGSMEYFFDKECLQCIGCYDNEGKKPLDYYMCKDFFELKFLENGEPKNSTNIGLRNGLCEILEAYANSSYDKVGKKMGVSMIKDLISDDVIESFKLIYELHKIKKGLTMNKNLNLMNAGSKFVLISAEEGCSLLDACKKEELESNDSDRNTDSSKVIYENCIEFENIVIDEISISSDSSSSDEFNPMCQKKAAKQIGMFANF